MLPSTERPKSPDQGSPASGWLVVGDESRKSHAKIDQTTTPSVTVSVRDGPHSRHSRCSTRLFSPLWGLTHSETASKNVVLVVLQFMRVPRRAASPPVLCVMVTCNYVVHSSATMTLQKQACGVVPFRSLGQGSLRMVLGCVTSPPRYR